MSIRLNKVLKECNIGLQTAVEFLQKKGYDTEANPNTKITDEQYQLLIDQFKRDKGLKDDAKALSLRRQHKEKNATITIKDTTPQPEPKPESKLRRFPKIIGKINIFNFRRQKDKPAEPKAAEPKAAEPKPIEQKPIEPKPVEQKPVEQKPVEPKPVEQKPVEQKPIEQKPAEPKPIEQKPVEQKPAEPKPVEQKPAEQKPIEQKPIEPKPAEQKPIEQKPAEPKHDDVFRLPIEPQKAVHLNVKGHIDLSTLNQTTRPRRKTREERRRERDSKATTTATPKKRVRINKERVDITAITNQNTTKHATPLHKHAPHTPLHPEVSDEEVAKQVKETLARLTTGKSKFGKSVKYRKEKRESARATRQEQQQEQAKESKILKLTEFVTANELAAMMNVPVTEVISTCMSIGIMVSINQRMDAETINLVADEFGYKTEYVSATVSEAIIEEEDDEADLIPRAPIVTVMGHVDHGKTSLLDYIRKTNVIAGEAGGITQHIGAYNVTLDDGRHITFLDTPGHEAFTAMRARGAQVTDVAIIIIAADDDIMPQTKEAINHAMAANVPIVFAINKIDKPGANPDKIKEGLAAMNFLVEDWGGKYQSQDISAKKGTGVKELLEKVLLEAEMLDLKANPNRKATGSIIESSLDKGRGYIATVLVANGTLHVGDILLAGTHYGRIKAMFNERNQRVTTVLPAQAATILGLNGAPTAGDTFHIMNTEQQAREITAKRQQLQREQGLRTQKILTLDEVGRRIAMGGFKELNIIVKGDVDGSVEALADSLIKLSAEKIAVNVIHKAVGQISESDVALAAASQAIIIGFQVRPSAAARKAAEQQGVDIRLYSIIYDAIDDVKAAMEGMLAPEVKEQITATLEVRQVYHISKVGNVAGAYVTDGTVTRTDNARLIRDGIVIYTGHINTLKRFKDDAKEVNTNFECGISLTNYDNIQQGDIIETYKTIEVKAKL